MTSTLNQRASFSHYSRHKGHKYRTHAFEYALSVKNCAAINALFNVRRNVARVYVHIYVYVRKRKKPLSLKETSKLNTQRRVQVEIKVSLLPFFFA